MTAVMAVVSFLRKLPREAWIALTAAVVAFALVRGVLTYGDRQFSAGKRAAAAGVAFDSALVARVAGVVAERTAHTDTVTRNVVKTRRIIDTVIVQLPPEVANVPEVKALVAAVQTLTVQVDSLTTAHAAERAAWTEQAKVNTAALYALRVIGTAQRDTIATLTKRPTRLRAFSYALAAGALGVVAGVVK